MGKVLYRTYRSRGFDEVVGQEHITDTLRRSIDSGKIAHAYLFTGPRGVGKTSVARILAYAINDLDYSDEHHLDIIEIDAASNRRIDDIRELRDRVHIAPASAKYKVYIIDEVHMLTTESFNALLKTLEEPPAHVVFIMATTEAHKVPATIQSRAQQFQFMPAKKDSLVKHLRSIADKESISIDDEALELIAERGDGSFRDSVSLLDQLRSIPADPITASSIESALGLTPREKIDQLIVQVISGNVEDAKKMVDQLLSSGVSPSALTAQMSSKLASDYATDIRSCQLLHDLLSVPRSHLPHAKLIATLMTHSLNNSSATSSIVSQSQPKQSQPSHDATTNKKKLETKPAKSIATAVTASQPVITSEPMSKPAHKSDGKLDWQKVLAQLENDHPTLHSIVKRANFIQTDESIVLEFDYALHRKKLESPSLRSALADAIVSHIGSCPEIIIRERDRTLTTEAADVAAIMGGGEPVAI